MNDYIKFLVEEIKKEKTIEGGIISSGEKTIKEIKSPISQDNKKEISIEYNNAFINKSENSIVSFDFNTEEKINYNISEIDIVENDKTSIDIELIQEEEVKNPITVEFSNSSIGKESVNIYNTSLPENKEEINIDVNYEELEKIGKPIESKTLTSVLDYAADSLDAPYLSISSFGFFNWKRFEENMNSLWNNVNYYPNTSAADMMNEYANLGPSINEANLMDTASSMINIVSFEIGARREKINKGRYDLRPKPEFSGFNTEKIQKTIKEDYLDGAYESSRDIAPESRSISAEIDDGFDNLPSLRNIGTPEETGFNTNQDSRSISAEIDDAFDNFPSLRVAGTPEKTGFRANQDSRSILAEIDDGLDNSKSNRNIGTLEKTGFETGQDSRNILAEIDDGLDVKKDEIIADINYNISGFRRAKSEKFINDLDNNGYGFSRITDNANSIGYIYVSPVNDDATGGASFIRIPLQNNLINTGESLRANYISSDFLGRIGSIQQYIRTDSQSLSLETEYYVEALEGEGGYSMKDLQKIEMMYKSLVFPKIRNSEEGYSFYTRPPIINIEIGNLNSDKKPLKSNTALTVSDYAGDIINNFFTRIKYINNTTKVELRDFIVTDINIEKDYERTPFFLKEESSTINNNTTKVYSPKDLMRFKVTINITEIDPNYFGILPSFGDYASFATG